MSVGTWLLSVYGPAAGLAAVAEFARPAANARRTVRFVGSLGRPAGILAASVAPMIATYTAVLLTDTATPAWSSARKELPFVFAGSAASAAGGLAMVLVSTAQAAPARSFALAGVVGELAAEHAMKTSMSIAAETLGDGVAGRWHRLANRATALGAVLAISGRRSRYVSAAGGLALVCGSAATRFAIFEAGQASARDPKYTVIPQRKRRNSSA
jgi:hypothetical protein